jgi:hypothetical protein
LSDILQALTRYSANDLELPVSDLALFTGVSMDLDGLPGHIRDRRDGVDRYMLAGTP